MADRNSLSGMLANSLDLHAGDPGRQALDLNPIAPQNTPPLRVGNRLVPSQIDQQGVLDEATARDLALQEAAAGAAPNNNQEASIASMLGIAGNIAGAISGRGAAGNPGLQLAEQMRQEGRLQQESFFRRVRQEEEFIKQERAARDAAINNQLVADSLRPMIKTLSDPNEQAMFNQLLNAGQVDQARSLFYNRQQEILSNQVRNMELRMKEQAHGVSQVKGLQSITKENIELQNLGASDYSQLTPGKQREEFKKQSTEFNSRIKKAFPMIEAYASLDEVLGGVDSDVAVKKLERLTGFMGQDRGTKKWMGTPEDKAAFQAINNFFTIWKTEAFGSQFPDTEKFMAEAGMGFTLGERFMGNLTRDPRALQLALNRFKGEIRAKLSSAEQGLDPAIVTKLSVAGLPSTSLQNFEQALQLNRELGGFAGSLDRLPPELADQPNAQDLWLQSTPSTKKKLLIQLKSRRGQ